MRTASPPLVPIFRSDLQAHLLARVLEVQERTWTVTELAESLARPISSVNREVIRLAGAGILRAERRGGARHVRPNGDWPHLEALRRLVLGTAGVPAVLRQELATISGIDAAYIFGSWARRYLGEMGEAPADIDLLVIGRPETSAVYDACRETERTAGWPVNAVFVTPESWKVRDGGFLEEVASGPLVPVIAEAGS